MNERRYVEHLPDLIQETEYDSHPGGGLLRLRVRATPDGIEILADGMRPELLESLLARLSGAPIDQILCG